MATLRWRYVERHNLEGKPFQPRCGGYDCRHPALWLVVLQPAPFPDSGVPLGPQDCVYLLPLCALHLMNTYHYLAEAPGSRDGP